MVKFVKSITMKIFNAEQIRRIDAATIDHEPVASADLMERAASALYHWIVERYEVTTHFSLFAGPGNNGGDALALARIMVKNGYKVKVFIINTGGSFSDDFQVNLDRLRSAAIIATMISDEKEIPDLQQGTVVIDGIFGSGLSHPVSGLPASVIRMLNQSGHIIISIDIPSGLFCDRLPTADSDAIICASYTLSFQFPKLTFMTHEGYCYTGRWEVLEIGLLPDAIASEHTSYFYVTTDDISSLIKGRSRFDHKGVFGHALIIAGSYGKAGAAILASSAALRSGAGLVTCHLPVKCVSPFQCALPEAMASPDDGDEHITSLPEVLKYDAVGVGPGIGTDPDTRKTFAELLSSYRNPMVVDADGLNILSLEPDMISLLPENSVLTPHPGEFSRLTGVKNSGLERLSLQMEFASRYRCIVVLKGAFTSVALPDGRVFFNSTGNPGMATAGSGDTLTGIITSLLAQGYLPADAAVTGVFLHGLAGDLALSDASPESLMAGDIIRNLGMAYKLLA